MIWGFTPCRRGTLFRQGPLHSADTCLTSRLSMWNEVKLQSHKDHTKSACSNVRSKHDRILARLELLLEHQRVTLSRLDSPAHLVQTCCGYARNHAKFGTHKVNQTGNRTKQLSCSVSCKYAWCTGVQVSKAQSNITNIMQYTWCA